MEIDSKPERIDRLDRRLIQLKIENEALKKEKDEASKQRLSKLNEEINDLEKQLADLNELWRTEKANVQDASKIMEKLEQARLAMETAQRAGDLERMAKLCNCYAMR